MDREQENRPDMAEQGQAVTPDDPKAKFSQMLEKAKARGQEARREFEAGKRTSEKGQYVDMPGEGYRANADVKGLLAERDMLARLAESRIADKSEQSQAELGQIQDRMAEIDQDPKVLGALQSQAERFKESPEDIDKAEWELDLKRSKEKAGELLLQLPALEEKFARLPGFQTEKVLVSEPHFGVFKVEGIKEANNGLAQELNNFLKEFQGVIIPVREGNNLDVKEPHTYSAGIIFNGRQGMVTPEELFKRVRSALEDGQKLDKFF